MGQHSTDPVETLGRSADISAKALYDVSDAAPGYSNVTGLVSTFAFAAVVLVFLIAATAPHPLKRSQKVDMGYATILFSLGFLGCLISAFAFAALGGAPNSSALVTNSMLVASVVAVCLVSVLGGFEALAKAFLPAAAAAFTVLCAVAAVLSPILVWFPVYDIAVGFWPDGSPKAPRARTDESPETKSELAAKGSTLRRWVSTRWRGQSTEARAAIKEISGLTCVGAVAALIGLGVHALLESHRHYTLEYYCLGFLGLVYTAAVIVGALVFVHPP
jgi:hypothetical protein